MFRRSPFRTAIAVVLLAAMPAASLAACGPASLPHERCSVEPLRCCCAADDGAAACHCRTPAKEPAPAAPPPVSKRDVAPWISAAAELPAVLPAVSQPHVAAVPRGNFFSDKHSLQSRLSVWRI